MNKIKKLFVLPVLAISLLLPNAATATSREIEQNSTQLVPGTNLEESFTNATKPIWSKTFYLNPGQARLLVHSQNAGNYKPYMTYGLFKFNPDGSKYQVIRVESDTEGSPQFFSLGTVTERGLYAVVIDNDKKNTSGEIVPTSGSISVYTE
ncbi:hypothetical protein [Brevibacillus formosus]|uniref:hypothetical protein n=1 Tax=Brevibacillus formosus TaxID=54913 RepID=UPI003F1C359F